MSLTFSNTVTLGDILLLIGFIGSLFANYIWIIRRIDLIASRQTATDLRVEDLRHGRGLVIQGGDWPDAVKRCFGFSRHGG